MIIELREGHVEAIHESLKFSKELIRNSADDAA